MKKYISLTAAILVGTTVSLSAIDFTWTIPNTSGIFSNGDAISDGFTFQAGTFSADFNVADFGTWGSSFLTSGIERNTFSWNNLGNANFPTFGSTGTTAIMRPGGDVQAGDQLYIWGYNSLDVAATSEWILLTNESWILPTTTAPGGTVPSGPLWDTSNAGTIALFGSINHTTASGLENVMQTQAIPEPSTYALIFGLGILGFIGYRRVRK